MGKRSILMDWKNKYCENVYAIQGNLHIQCNPYQNTMDFLQRVGTNNLKICVKSKKTKQPGEYRKRKPELGVSQGQISKCATQL